MQEPSKPAHLPKNEPERQREPVPLLPVSNAEAVVTLMIVNALRDETL